MCNLPCTEDFLLALVAVIFPPLPVWIRTGLCSCDSILNLILCCFGIVPGIIHAWLILCWYPNARYDYQYHDLEGASIVIVHPDGNRREYRTGGPMLYGAVNTQPSSANTPAHVIIPTSPQPDLVVRHAEYSEDEPPPLYTEVAPLVTKQNSSKSSGPGP